MVYRSEAKEDQEMTTDSSDEQSLSNPTKEKQTGSVLPDDHDPENAAVNKERQAGGDVDTPSPRKVNGVSVRKFLSLSSSDEWPH